MRLPKLTLKGFTMIELLVVIAVIGILAVALLATLNPLEQIRKGRDTRTRSDASQLASAIERYNASLGRFPWQATEGEDVDDGPNGEAIGFERVNGGGTIADCTATGGATCDIADLMAVLESTNEVKTSFIDRITATTSRSMYLYYNDEATGGSVTVCFMPESNTFAREAFDRCAADTFGTEFNNAYGSTSQTADTATMACPDGADSSAYTAFDATDADELICIP